MIDHEARAKELIYALSHRDTEWRCCLEDHDAGQIIAAYGRAVERETRLQALQDCLDIIAAERNDYFNKTQGA